MSPRLTYLIFKNPTFFDINKLQMQIENINNCVKNNVANSAARNRHTLLKALLAQLDRASVF